MPAQLNTHYTGLTEGEIQPGSWQGLFFRFNIRDSKVIYIFMNVPFFHFSFNQ